MAEVGNQACGYMDASLTCSVGISIPVRVVASVNVFYKAFWRLLILNCRGLPDDAFHDLDMGGEGLEGMRKETKEKAQKALEEMKRSFTTNADMDLDKELANAPKVRAAILRKNPAQVRKELEDDTDWVTSVK